MRNRFKACAGGSMALALSIVTPACTVGEEGPEANGSEDTGTLKAAITAGASRHDVTAVYYKVVSASGTCADQPITETTSPLEDEDLPGSVLPPGSGPHAGADGLFVLPAGDYRVCATPLSNNGPSAECAPAEGTVTILPEATTEIVLVSQCGGPANGAGDVIVALNDPPQLTGLNILPSKFITQCETATLTATAEDPDGDAVTFQWDLLAGTGSLAGAGDIATFTPSGPGDASVKVTATDAIGGSAQLTFPIHVSAAACASCSDGVQNQGETGVDCGGPCAPCGGGGSISIFTFTDTPADDVSSTALYDFFTSLGPVSASQFILFEVSGPGVGGAWCADHADFYVNNYLSLSVSDGLVNSGSWPKYTRSTDGAWSGPDTGSYTNYYGIGCGSISYSWCSEWGLGSHNLAVLPSESSSEGESYADGNWSNGADWSIRIAVGPDRLSTCGF